MNTGFRPAMTCRNAAATCKRMLTIAFAGGLIVMSLGGAGTTPLEPSVDGLIDLPMYQSPRLEAPESIVTFSPRLKTLWLAALQREDAELRRQAVDAFASAREMGMPNLDDMPARLQSLVADDPDTLVRLSAARALAAFEAKQAAPTLRQWLTTNPDATTTQVLDAILAQWQDADTEPLWRARLTDTNAPLTTRISAAKALAATNAQQSVTTLMTVVVDPSQPIGLRLPAAEAVGKLTQQGQESAAQKLSRDDRQFGALLATRVLSNHASEQATQLLRELARHDNPAVTSHALAALNRIDPTIVQAQADDLLNHVSADVRLQAVIALAYDPTPARLSKIATALGDWSVEIRSLTRDTLIKADTTDTLRPVVDAEVARALASDDWRAAEQGALIAGQLRLKSQTDRLTKQLRSSRPEVRLAAAEALQNIAEPSTLPAVFDRAKELTKQLPSADQKDRQAYEYELTQLVMTMGKARYTAADAFLRTFIPKSVQFGVEPRAAAIWSLGLLHEGQPDAKLAQALEGRIRDVESMEPEAEPVRRFAAIALGRMKSEASLPTLRKFMTGAMAMPEFSVVCRWAIMQITDETLPEIEPGTSSATGWFLQPLD